MRVQINEDSDNRSLDNQGTVLKMIKKELNDDGYILVFLVEQNVT